MRFSAGSSVVLAGLIAGLASASGCSSGGTPNNVFMPTGAAGSSAGSNGSAGSAVSPTPSGAAGTNAGSSGSNGGTGGSATGSAGSAAGGSTAGANGADGGAGAGSTAGSDGGMSTGPAGTSGPLGDITKVVPSAGCGMDPTGLTPGKGIMFTIQTMGTKPANCADSVCGPWSYARNYWITLPVGYDKTKAYPLVFEGPGCGGNGGGVYSMTDGVADNVGNTVIKVGLSPPPNAIGHATNPGQGCFDDKEGDSSVDWVFYENLYDKLSTQLCFDRNRVFSGGDSSGAWFSNELGCKYAGDPTRPVRGIMPNTGGLPAQPMYEPTCTNKPMAGFWCGETMDPQNAFSNNVFAINRALKVNGCTTTAYDPSATATLDNFPIGGGNPDTTCKLIKGCPQLYPLVVCLINGSNHDSHVSVVNPGVSTFLKLFEAAPFLTAP
jgi:hypothetical protein